MPFSEQWVRRLLDLTSDRLTVWAAVRDTSGNVHDFRVVLTDSASTTSFDGLTSMSRTVPSAEPPQAPSSGTSPGEALIARCVEVLRTGKPDRVTVTWEHPLEGTVHRDVEVRRLSDSDLATIFVDDGERTRADRALAEQRERFRMAFDDAPVGMAVAGLDPAQPGRYLMVNAAYARLLGYPRDRMVGMSFRQLTHPDDRDVDRDQAAAMAAGRQPLYCREKRMMKADGEIVWVRMSAAPVDVDGVPRYVVTHIEDITDRRRAEEELAYRALYDTLTGLPNRSLLLDRLAHTLKEQSRREAMLAVLFLDLDRFKDVNDSLGHEAGDLVLVEVAARIGAVVRDADTAARLAGDEFVVAATVDDIEQAVLIAERLHEQISAPMSIGNHQVRVAPSIGIASADRGPASGATTSTGGSSSSERHAPVSDTPEDLLRRADIAMYQAKRHGLRTWEIYDEQLHRQAVQRLIIEEELQAAIEQDRLRLLYQPIIDLRDGSVVSAEALLRIQSPDPRRGLLTPAHFIDVAEESNLIIPIGAWALREACTQLAAWQRIRPQLQISVNISARQAHRLVVADQVLNAVSEAGIDPADLVIELTERVLVDSQEGVLTDLQRVVSTGCGLAIDDFGTGYSSLTYLQRFPVSTVKIDRSFVDGVGRRPHDDAIVRAVTGLAHSLDLTAVAEGVETPGQLDALRDLGCHRAQGYYIGRPMPSSRLRHLLAR